MFEQTPKGSEGASHADRYFVLMFQVERTGKAKALRQEHAWCDRGIGRKPVRWDHNKGRGEELEGS